MKFAPLTSLLLLASPTCFIASGCTPTSAQPTNTPTQLDNTSQPVTTPSIELSSKIGQACSVRYPESADDNAIVDGTLSQVTEQWIVITKGRRSDILGTGKESNEFWIRKNGVTSIEFKG